MSAASASHRLSLGAPDARAGGYRVGPRRHVRLTTAPRPTSMVAPISPRRAFGRDGWRLARDAPAQWLSSTSCRRRLPEQRTPRSTQEARRVLCVDALPGNRPLCVLSSARPCAALRAASCRSVGLIGQQVPGLDHHRVRRRKSVVRSGSVPTLRAWLDANLARSAAPGRRRRAYLARRQFRGLRRRRALSDGLGTVAQGAETTPASTRSARSDGMRRGCAATTTCSLADEAARWRTSAPASRAITAPAAWSQGERPTS